MPTIAKLCWLLLLFASLCGCDARVPAPATLLYYNRQYLLMKESGSSYLPANLSISELDCAKTFVAARAVGDRERFFLVGVQGGSVEEMPNRDMLAERWKKMFGRELNLCDVRFYQSESLH